MTRIFLQKWLIVPYIMLLVFMLTELADLFPALTEAYYSQKIYPFTAKVLSSISSILPFSISDSFYLILIITLPTLIILAAFKKVKVKQALKIVINLVACAYILFYVLWGFNYYRLPLNQRLNLNEHTPQKEDFIKVFEQIIDDTNASYCDCSILTKPVIDSLIEASYFKLQNALNIDYPAGKRPDKKITFSGFYSKSGISGYYGPFFNEVHVNKNTPPQQYPHTLAHEKAHQLGITSEAEANFYAWLACTQSTSKVLHYSANIAILRYFLIQSHQLNEDPDLVSKISPKVKEDIIAIRQHWNNLRNEKIDKAASKVNDAYLKTNKIKAGIKDYNGVVKHVMNFSLDSTFQERHKLAVK